MKIVKMPNGGKVILSHYRSGATVENAKRTIILSNSHGKKFVVITK